MVDFGLPTGLGFGTHAFSNFLGAALLSIQMILPLILNCLLLMMSSGSGSLILFRRCSFRILNEVFDVVDGDASIFLMARWKKVVSRRWW